MNPNTSTFSSPAAQAEFDRTLRSNAGDGPRVLQAALAAMARRPRNEVNDARTTALRTLLATAR